MNKNITELFCFIDDFCNSVDKNFAEKLLPSSKKPTRTPEIKHSEILTIILLYHQSRCEDFKSFYVHYLKLLYGSAFSKLPSYDRFIVRAPRKAFRKQLVKIQPRQSSSQQPRTDHYTA